MRTMHVHINHALIIGRISKAGPKLSYASSGTPICSLVVEVDEVGKDHQTFTTYLPVEVSGKYAETVAAEVEPGDEIQIVGKLKYKSVVDPKTQAKTSKLIISTWGVNQRTPAIVASAN
jgi:single-stranded DNA-binding protein